MNNSKKFVFLLTSVFTLVFVGLGICRDNNRMLGVSTVSHSELYNIIDGRQREYLPAEIVFKGQRLQYCYNTDSYYITQSASNDQWQGSIVVSSGYDYKILNTGIDKKTVIRSNEPLKLFIYNDTSYDIKNITVSSLPVLSIKFSYNEGMDDYGQVTIIEPDAAGRTNVIDADTYYCRYHIRGASSLLYPKKSYKLNIVDSGGDSKKVSLLNMREDNDWVLNALYTDNSKIREKLCNNIWSNISDKFHRGVEYCELIIDGNYMGLYALQEPVDNKTFSRAKSTAINMFIKGWPEKYTEMKLYEENALEVLRSERNINVELTLDQCEDKNIYDALEIFRWIKNNEYVSESITVEFNRDNLLRYTLFCDMTMAEDNLYKNQKICAISDSRKNYTLYKTPWDLDITFINESIDFTNKDITARHYDYFYELTAEDDIWLKELYTYARQSYYTEEYLFSQIDACAEQLIVSGAYARDSAIWNTPALDSGVEYLKGVISSRISVLDKYYGGL